MSILAGDVFHHIGQWAGEPTLLAALRAPPFLPAAWFEMHLTWWAAAAVIGAVLVFVASRQANRRLLRAGQITLGVTLLWVLAALCFDTAGERLYKVHQALAAATDKGDVPTLVSFLAPTFVAGDLGINQNNAREVLTALFKTVSPSETHITAYKVDMHPDGGVVTRITVFAKVPDIGPTQSMWQLSWDDVPGADWRMTGADYVSPDKGVLPTGDMLKQ